ncbi:hypothetical protein IW262DRAFT_1295809 [Armillaria fumosa]|nr:hypothetical protein IW262DRAFT_1295809 [Armillaria fumosa]
MYSSDEPDLIRMVSAGFCARNFRLPASRTADPRRQSHRRSGLEKRKLILAHNVPGPSMLNSGPLGTDSAYTVLQTQRMICTRTPLKLSENANADYAYLRLHVSRYQYSMENIKVDIASTIIMKEDDTNLPVLQDSDAFSVFNGSELLQEQDPKNCVSVKESCAITCLYRARLCRKTCPSTKRGVVSDSFPPISRIFNRGRTFRRYYSRHRTVKGRKF